MINGRYSSQGVARLRKSQTLKLLRNRGEVNGFYLLPLVRHMSSYSSCLMPFPFGTEVYLPRRSGVLSSRKLCFQVRDHWIDETLDGLGSAVEHVLAVHLSRVVIAMK